MSVWNDKKIGDWSPTQLAKFVQETIASDPPPLPPQITLDSLSVIGDTEIGGELSVQSKSDLKNITIISPPFVYLYRAISGGNQSVSDNGTSVVNLDTVRWSMGTRDEINYNLSNNRIKFTRSGLYLIGALVEWESNTTGVRRIWIEHPTTSEVFIRDTRTAVSGRTTVNQMTTVRYFEKGSLARLIAHQDSGGALDISNNNYGPFFWAMRIGVPE